MRALLLQNDATRGALLARYCAEEKIAYQSLCARTKGADLEYLNLFGWEVVVLDLDEGVELRLNNLHAIRKEAYRVSTQILTISAVIDLAEEVELLAFRGGADDHVRWPVSRELFCERLRNLARRKKKKEGAEPGASLRWSEIELFPSTGRCLVSNTEVTLTTAEHGILKLMLEHPKWVFARSQLLERLGREYLDERTIDSHMKRLRRKLEKASKTGERYIFSVYGVGYTLREGQVRKLAA